MVPLPGQGICRLPGAFQRPLPLARPAHARRSRPQRQRFLLLPEARRQGRRAFRRSNTPTTATPTERGFADVWKKGCFGWEYKGKKKNLDEAYKQLLRYREALLNPPLLVVCDFDRYIIRTNFNGTVQETHEFTNDQIDRPENLRMLRALFENPDFLKPQRTTAQVTEEAGGADSPRSPARCKSAKAPNWPTPRPAPKSTSPSARTSASPASSIASSSASSPKTPACCPRSSFRELAKTGLDDPHHLRRGARRRSSAPWPRAACSAPTRSATSTAICSRKPPSSS